MKNNEEKIRLDYQLSFLKNNERACFWFWKKIKDSLEKENIDPDLMLNIVCAYDHSTRQTSILNYFLHPEIKLNIDDLKQQWGKIERDVKPFKWINIKNRDDVVSLLLKIQKITNTHTDILHEIMHSDSKELYQYIQYFFDDWDNSKEAKELSQIKIKKAWDQKKYRDKVKGKKVLNIYLDSKVKDELKKLAKEQNKTITSVIENLINREIKLINNTKAFEKINKNRTGVVLNIGSSQKKQEPVSSGKIFRFPDNDHVDR